MTLTDFTPYLSAGIDGLPKVKLQAPGGARAEIYLHGGHVTSWVPAGGDERLFLSRTSEFGPKSAIRGGVPVIFPQFSGRGPLLKHGFARRMDWELAACGVDPKNPSRTFATLQLKDSPATRTIWPHNFQFNLTVAVAGNELSLQVEITNSGAEAISFTTALHTYLRVADIQFTSIHGLGGRSYLDSAPREIEKRQPNADLTFIGEVDRIYFPAPEIVAVQDGENQVRVMAENFTDCVIWNPGAKKGAALGDLEANGYRKFVCVESGAILKAVSLEPGESWSADQRLTG